MPNDALSPEEIAALFKAEEAPAPDGLQQVVERFLISGWEAAASLLGEAATVANVAVRHTTAAEAGAALPPDTALGHTELKGRTRGPIWISLAKPLALGIAGLLFGEDQGERLSEGVLAALGEVLGQVVGSSLRHWGARVGAEMMAGPVVVSRREGAEPLPEAAGSAPVVLVTYTVRVGESEGTCGMVLAGTVAQELGGGQAQVGKGKAKAPAAGAAERARAAPEPAAAAYAFRDLSPRPAAPESLGIELIADVTLQVTVELGRTRRQIRDVLALGPGSVIELDKLAGETVDVLVNGKLIAKGEVVVIDENFGVRITDIIAPAERLSGLR